MSFAPARNRWNIRKQALARLMKRSLLLFGFLSLINTDALSQGTVNFNNNGLIPGNPPDVLVYFEKGVPLVGTNFVAQLYYGAPGSSESALTPVTSLPAPFRQPTTGIPGTWIGGTRTLTGFSQGAAVELQVRVWDITIAPDYLSAFTWGNGLYTAKGAPFSYTVPSIGSPPAAFLMTGFIGFTMVIPEPATYSLISLGLLLGFFFKRCVTRK